MSKSSPVAMADPASQPVVAVEIPLDQIWPSPLNKRRFRENPEFHRLCANVAKLGVIQAGVARPTERGYELIAGRRRWEALKATRAQTCRATMPLAIRELSDADAADICAAENMQRDDLNPLEHGEQIQSLLDVGWTIAQVAERYGRSEKWVARRASLVQLGKSWRTSIEQDGWAAEYSADLLEVIARLPPDVQDDVFAALNRDKGRLRPWEHGFPTAEDLRRHIDHEYLHVLAGAPWKMDDDTLLPAAGACDACTKRASSQPLLFGESDGDPKKKAGGDKCLDMSCYARKANAFAARKLVDLRRNGEALQLIGSGPGEEATKKKLRKAGAVGEYESGWKSCGKKDKGAVPAIFMTGPETGRVVYRTKEKYSGGSGRSGRGGGAQSKPKSMKEKLKGLEKRRRIWVINEVCARLQRIVDGKDTLQNPAVFAGREGYDVRRYILAFGTAWNGEDVGSDKSRNFDTMRRPKGARSGWGAFDEAGSVADIEAELWAHVLRIWIRRLSGYQVQSYYDKLHGECERIAELAGWSFVDIVGAAEAEIPTPKSWLREVLDGKPTAKSKGKKAKAAEAAASNPAGKRKRTPPLPDGSERTCRECKCTEDRACEGGCFWVETDLCSRCTPTPAANAGDPWLGLLDKGKPAKGRKGRKQPSIADAVHERVKDLQPAGVPAAQPKSKSRKGAARKRPPF